MPNAASIISVDEAMEFLNIKNEDSAPELAEFIESASQMWETRVGPAAAYNYSEWHDGGGPHIMLRHTPVLNVTAVTEAYASSLTYTLALETFDGVSGGGTYGYSFDPDTGLLTRRTNGMAARFAAGTRNVHVTYTAGYAMVPADIRDAIKLLVRHLWETQRGGSRRPGSDVEPIATYQWPNRVQEIASGYIVPGIA